jgi:hypothetical protein
MRTQAHRRPPAGDRAAQLAATIAAILDRPNVAWYGAETLPRCECTGCEAIRARGWSCNACGFHGAPIVAPCECRSTRASNIAYCREQLALGHEVAYHSRALAEAEAIPDRMCGTSDERGKNPRRPGCGHGFASCPTCGGDGPDFEHPAGDGATLTATIREIRATLAIALGSSRLS